MSLTQSLCVIMSTRWLETRCSQSICHQLSSSFFITELTFFREEIEREKKGRYSLFFSPFYSLTRTLHLDFQHRYSITREREREKKMFLLIYLSTSWKYTQNLIYCIHALVRPNSINNLTRGGNERDFPYSLVEPSNDDSISLTHTHGIVSLFD